MTGVEIALVGLKIVAFMKNLGREDVAPRREKRLVGEKKRRLAGLLEAVAAPVEEPAVIQTAKPAVLDSSVAQIGAPLAGTVRTSPQL